jgi:hypothetical protein
MLYSIVMYGAHGETRSIRSNPQHSLRRGPLLCRGNIEDVEKLRN